MVTNQFVVPDRILLPNQFDNNKEILSAETGTVINRIIVCNTAKTNIKISLITVQVLGVQVPIRCYTLHDIAIQPNESMDLLSLKGQGNPIGELFLKDGDSLICNSDSSDQKFDLTIYFTILKEYDDLPI